MVLFLVSRVSVMFHRTCVHIIFISVFISVLVAEAVLMSIHNGLSFRAKWKTREPMVL